MNKYIGKHIKILNDEWDGEFTKEVYIKSSKTFTISLVL